MSFQNSGGIGSTQRWLARSVLVRFTGGVPDPSLVSNPFAALTLIAAPAVLTNASSVLAMSTSNRFLRASERIRSLSARLDSLPEGDPARRLLLTQVPRVEKQGFLLLHGLAAAYVALAGFASASLISVVGAALGSLSMHPASDIAVGLALIVGFVGAGGLVHASVNLFHATQLSMLNIQDEARMIREKFPASGLDPSGK